MTNKFSFGHIDSCNSVLRAPESADLEVNVGYLGRAEIAIDILPDHRVTKIQIGETTMEIPGAWSREDLKEFLVSVAANGPNSAQTWATKVGIYLKQKASDPIGLAADLAALIPFGIVV